MRKIVVSFICAFLTFFVNAQDSLNQTGLTNVLMAAANQMASLYKSADYKGYVKYVHPIIVHGVGGETKMLELLNLQSNKVKSQGVVINSITFDRSTAIISVKNELQSTISQHTELKSSKGRIITYTTLIAISADKGKTWKFLDTSKMDLATVRKLLPSLSIEITLPPKQKPTVYPE